MRDPFAEVEVAGLLRARRYQLRTVFETGDLLQGAGEPGGVASELHPRRIGQPLALTADRGFDEPGEKDADRADQPER